MIMAFEDIFWVEDNPSFLERTILHAEEQGISRKAFFNAITFVHDMVTAKKILSSKKFRHYVLDFDFPNMLTQERTQKIREYLTKLEKGEEAYLKDDDRLSEENNGWLLINRELQDSKDRIIISSRSGFAKMAA